MTICGRVSTLVILLMVIVGFYLSPESAKADEPGEEVMQELIRSDARTASTANDGLSQHMCNMMQENKKSSQLPAQGSTGALANEKPVVPDDDSGGQVAVSVFSSQCQLDELLRRGDFEVRKAGCVKSQNSLGYNCDFVIQPNASAGEKIKQFFHPDGVYTSRFVRFGSKWYLALDTSPFARYHFIRGAFSPR